MKINTCTHCKEIEDASQSSEGHFTTVTAQQLLFFFFKVCNVIEQ